MADAALDSGRNGGKQAEGEASGAAASAAAASGGIKAWLPLIITVLLMPALAFATTKFVLLPQIKKSLGESAAPATSETPGASAEGKDGTSADGTKTKVKIPLNKILVNVAGTMGTRYLMTSITVVGNSEELHAKVEENKDQLMDIATSALSTKGDHFRFGEAGRAQFDPFGIDHRI